MANEKDLMEHVIYTTKGKPIDFARYTYCTVKYKYLARMVRNPIKYLMGDLKP